MYEVAVRFSRHYALVATNMVQVVTLDDSPMPMCSIGDGEEVVLRRGEEVTLRAQRFNPMED
jgi:hypothetical protein